MGSEHGCWRYSTDGFWRNLLDLDFKVVWPPLGAPFYDNSDVLHPNLRHEFFSEECVFEGAGTRRGEIVDPGSLSDKRLLSVAHNLTNIEAMSLQGFRKSIEGYDEFSMTGLISYQICLEATRM